MIIAVTLPLSQRYCQVQEKKKKQKLCLKSFKKFKVLVSSYWNLHRYFLSLWGFSHIFCVLELDGPDNNLIFILHKYVREANIEYFTQA